MDAKDGGKGKCNNLNCVALILSRGSSKSIPRKNVQPFNGLPLIVHTLQIITKCQFFTSFWVSTDDEETIQIIQNYFPEEDFKVNIHSRTKFTASDTSSSISAVQEFLNCHQEPDWDSVALIQITSPLQSIEYLRQAFDKLAQNGTESVFSAFIDKSLRWSQSSCPADRNQIKPLNFDPKNRPRRQDWNGELVESGHFYFATINLLKSGFFQSPDHGDVVIIPPDLCIELDYPYQWPIAEFMDRQRRKSDS